MTINQLFCPCLSILAVIVLTCLAGGLVAAWCDSHQ